MHAWRSSAAIFVLALALASAATAATPSSGGVAVSQATATTWKGDIVLGPNPAAGEQACVDGTTCDVYTLTVAGQPADWTGKLAHVSIAWTNLGVEYDVYVHKDTLAGALVTSAGNVGTTENAVDLDPAATGTGVYVVHVVGAQGVIADPYTGTITTGAAAAGPQPAVKATGPAPRFQIFTPSQAQLAAKVGTSAGEPSIGANPNTGAILFQSGLQTLKVTTDESCASTPMATWSDVSSPLTSKESLDPILFTDTRTGRTQVSQLTGADSLSAYTDNDGATWVPSQGGGIPSGIDHQTLGGGPFHAPLPSGLVYSDAVYYCTQADADANCALSLDGGLTFGPAVPIYNLTQCGGLHGHVKVGPDGTVYVPNDNCSSTGGQAVVVSEDNGQTWAVRGVPTSRQGHSDPSVATDRGGTLYFSYADADEHAVVAISHDHGKTFSKLVDVGAPFGIQAVEFAEMTAGDPGRAAMMFLGSVTAGNPQAADYPGVWHLYVATTYDGGNTWSTVDVTPNDPVQRGPIWNSGGAVVYRNLLDFNDLTIDGKGRLVAAFADGCFEAACVQGTGSGNGYTAIASVLRQVGGKSLLGVYDHKDNSEPGAPQLKVQRNGGLAYLSWNTSNNGGAPVQKYTVYRGTASGAETMLASAGTATSFVDPTADPNTTYYYKIVAKNQFGSSCGNDEVMSVPAGGSCAPGGQLVGTFASGAQTGAPANAYYDIRAIGVGEPKQPDGVDRLVFTVKVGSLATLPPSSQYRVLWTTPNSPSYNFYVGMNTDAQGHATFEYGTYGVTSVVVTGVGAYTALGVPDFGSYTADGTITIGIDKALVGSSKAGDVLGAVTAKAYLLTGSASRQPLDAAYGISYLVRGAGYCH